MKERLPIDARPARITHAFDAGLYVAIIEIMDILADVGAQPAPRNGECFHAFNMLLIRAGVRIAIWRLVSSELDQDVIRASV